MMPVKEVRRLVPGRGMAYYRDSAELNGLSRRIVCQFPNDIFARVRLRAAQKGSSFAAEVRLLVEWGLECAELDMGDDDEPDTKERA